MVLTLTEDASMWKFLKMTGAEDVTTTEEVLVDLVAEEVRVALEVTEIQDQEKVVSVETETLDQEKADSEVIEVLHQEENQDRHNVLLDHSLQTGKIVLHHVHLKQQKQEDLEEANTFLYSNIKVPIF